MGRVGSMPVTQHGREGVWEPEEQPEPRPALLLAQQTFLSITLTMPGGPSCGSDPGLARVQLPV